MSDAPTVAVVTLGCGRNEVDSGQVSGALEAAGFRVTDDAGTADCVLVNTCTFIAPAREESLEVILDAVEVTRGPVLVIGCMAERYGDELAAALPEVAGVHGFADYPRLPALVHEALTGAPAPRPAHEQPRPSRRSLPVVDIAAGTAPPTASFPVRTVPRGAWAYLKLAGGCDRRCTFCTIPSYRGRFASRPVAEVLAEARWLAEAGVRELVCVSENTTSYGKDLEAGRGAQVELIQGFSRIDGLERVRLLYLQPDEITEELLDAMAASAVVASYFDLSLQHASPGVLQRMARAGGADRFLDLIDAIRRRDPHAVFRSSFICGFPGETDDDVEVLEAFLAEAGLDWAGFFTFSVEDGTPSAVMPGQVPADEACARRDRLIDVAEAVAEERALAFVGRELRVLVDETARSWDGGRSAPVDEDRAVHGIAAIHVSAEGAVGRSYREAPETDGEIRLQADGKGVDAGSVVSARVVAADGVDLVAEMVPAGP